MRAGGRRPRALARPCAGVRWRALACDEVGAVGGEVYQDSVDVCELLVAVLAHLIGVVDPQCDENADDGDDELPADPESAVDLGIVSHSPPTSRARLGPTAVTDRRLPRRPPRRQEDPTVSNATARLPFPYRRRFSLCMSSSAARPNPACFSTPSRKGVLPSTYAPMSSANRAANRLLSAPYSAASTGCARR